MGFISRIVQMNCFREIKYVTLKMGEIKFQIFIGKTAKYVTHERLLQYVGMEMLPALTQPNRNSANLHMKVISTSPQSMSYLSWEMLL